MILSRIRRRVAELVGDDQTLMANLSFIGPEKQARLLEYVVELIRPALPLLVFRPFVEMTLDEDDDGAGTESQKSEWNLQCLVLGPKWRSGHERGGLGKVENDWGADLVLGEDGNLYVLDWSGNWVRTPQGAITYRATTRRYENFEDAFDDGWGPVDHYLEQIEHRLEAVVQLQRSLPQSDAKSL